MDKVKEYAKTLATFAATIAINMVISGVQSDQPWPHTKEDWIRYLATSFTAALATAIPRNKMTQGQLDTAKQKGEVIGDAVVVSKQKPVPDWPSPTEAVVDDNPRPVPAPEPAPTPADTPTVAISIVDQIIADKKRQR